MIPRAVLIGAALGAALVSAAWADIVHLKSGGRLEGTAEVEGDTVTVTNRYGFTSVPLSDVKLIEKTATALDRYGKMAQAAPPGDLTAQRRLAGFCRENHLSDKERYHLLLILRLRPGDIEARSRLGYVTHRGRWVTKADEMYDRGLTQFRGQWVTPAAKEATLKRESERRRELAARRRRERDERLARLKAKRLAEERRERERERKSAGFLGIGYVDQSYYRPRGYYRYSGYYEGYSVFSPYHGGYYLPCSYGNTGWRWYRQWTGVGLSGEYRTRDWRIKWGW